MSNKTSDSPSPRWLIAAVLILALLLLAGGFWFYHAQEQRMREDAEANLESVARLKVRQITDWRAERLADAAVLTASPLFIEGAALWMDDPEAKDRAHLLTGFRALNEHYGYQDILLVDTAGTVRLSLIGHASALHPDAREALEAAFRSRQPVLTDLHADPADDSPHVDVIAPLFAGAGGTGDPVGAVVLQVDASEFLYPLIQSWPTASQSAETLLVRRDGDAVLYLNELRHQRGTALALRSPLSETNVPAVMAVLGREGVVEGRDYRGVEVLAVVYPIPDSPWFMVTKIDRAEALAVWKVRSTLILSLIVLCVLGVAGLGALIWQMRQKAHYRALAEARQALHRSEERYRTTLMSIGDAVIATDPAGSITMMNPVAEKLTGWSLAEAAGKPLDDIFHIVNEETRQKVESPVDHVRREGAVVGLANHTLLIARDGSEFPIADSGAPIRNEAGQLDGVVLVFRDQTEDRAAQQALRESEEQYHQLFEMESDAIFLIENETGQILQVNAAATELYGYSREELLSRRHTDLSAEPEKTRQAAQSPPAVPAQPVMIPLRYHRKKDGTVFPVEITARFFTWQGQSVHIAAIRDITERKQAEQALRESEAFARATLDGLSAHIAIVDENGVILAVNQAWRDFAGENPPVTSNVCEGANYLAVCDTAGGENAEEAADFAAAIRAVLAGAEEVAAIEYPCHAPHGQRWFVGRVTRFPGDGPPRAVIAHENITARKLAEEKLRHSEALLNKVFETMPVGVWIADKTGRLIRSNEAGRRIWGGEPLVGPEEYGVFRARRLPSGEEIGPDDWALLRTINEGVAITDEMLEIEALDGVRRVILNYTAPVLDELGEVQAAIIVNHDITGRKRAEDALRESEAYVRLVLNSLPVGVAVNSVDPVVTFRYMNDSFLRIYRTTREALADPDAFWEAVYQDPEFREEIRKRVLEDIASGDPERLRWDDVPITRQGEETTYISAQNVPIPGRNMMLSLVSDTTERKRAEDALRQSEARYRNLVELSPIALFVNRDSRIEYVSPAGLTLFGASSPDEIIGRSPFDVFHPDYHAIIQERIRQMIEENVPVPLIEEKVIRLDGTVRDVEVAAAPFTDRKGLAIQVVLHDITERKQAEQELRETLQTAADIVSEIPSGLFIYQYEPPDRLILIQANPEAERLTGLNSKDWIGKEFNEIWPNARAAGLTDAYLKVARTGKTFQTEDVTYQDERVSGAFRIRVFRLPSSRLAVAFENITERKRAEQEVIRERDLLHALMDNVPDAIYFKDTGSRFTRSNQAHADLLGLNSPEEVVGKSDHDFFDPDFARETDSDEQEILRTGRPLVGKIEEMRYPDGSRNWVLATKVPIRDAEGRITGLVGISRDFTELKQAQEELASREATLQSVLRAAPIGIGLTRNRTFVWVNDHFLEIVGYSPDEIEGMSARPLYESEEEYERVGAALYGSSDPYAASSVETRIRRKDGRLIDVAVSTALLDPTDPAAGWIFTVRDITERRRAEQKVEHLLEQQTSINALTLALGDTTDPDSVHQTIYQWVSRMMDADFFVVAFYDAARQMIEAGYAVGDGNVLDVSGFPPIPLEAEGQGIQSQVIRTGQPVYQPDLRAATKNVTIQYGIDEEGRVHEELSDENGRPVVRSALYVPMKIEGSIIGVMQVQSYRLDAYTPEDLQLLNGLANVAAIAIQNARLYSELEDYSEMLEEAVEVRTAELKQVKERVEAILNNSSDAILLLGADGTVQEANRALFENCGYDPEEVYNQPLPAICRSPQTRTLQETVYEVIQKQEARRLEMSVHRKDGTSFDVDLALAPITGSSGLQGAVCSLRDITQLKEVERMKDAFVSNVSHELRTPITGMVLNHRLIQLDPDRQSLYLDRLGREIDRLNVLIEDLLRLSRLDQDRVELQLAPLDINTLAHQYVSDRLPLAEERDLELVIEREASLPPLIIDGGLIGQALSVVLTNALNYTPAGGRVAVCTLHKSGADGQWAGIRISDTGPGIPDEEIPYLFERFYRGRIGRDSGVSGTGLGLAIARQIVERHGGYIEVESPGVLGQGTTFTIWLPANQDEGQDT